MNHEPSNLRKMGVCIECSALGDETDKPIHAFRLCESHYRADLRRRGIDPSTEPARSDRHAGREMQAHAFVAALFQKFLLKLNDDKATAILSAEQIHEIRLLLNPHLITSQRFCVPRSLPSEMLQTYEPPSEPSAPAKVESRDKGTSSFFDLSPVPSAKKKRKSRVKMFPDNPQAKSGFPTHTCNE